MEVSQKTKIQHIIQSRNSIPGDIPEEKKKEH